jgi:pseudouridine-5'-phosphate glycosidase
MMALVIIEEIGLAEISPHNPLKVLHELLEPPKVPTIGISNWTLDASKMNRAVTLQRPDPDEYDLKESALKIAMNIHQEDLRKLEIFDKEYLPWLIKAYMKIFESPLRNFFGLRDFYCMIK